MVGQMEKEGNEAAEQTTRLPFSSAAAAHQMPAPATADCLSGWWLESYSAQCRCPARSLLLCEQTARPARTEQKTAQTSLWL